MGTGLQNYIDITNVYTFMQSKHCCLSDVTYSEEKKNDTSEDPHLKNQHKVMLSGYKIENVLLENLSKCL